MRDLIIKALTAQPFRPFRISLTGRSVYEILQPELVTVREHVMDVYRPDPASPDGKMLRSILALEHVVTLEFIAIDQPTIVPVRANSES
jgi:hypothetical protein